MSRSVIDILEELESTSGKNARLDILEAAKSNRILKQVFVAAQDPYTVYFVSKFKMPVHIKSGGPDDDTLLVAFLGLLEKLSKRELTGNAAKAAVVDILTGATTLQQKWCQRILLKNLRCGLQESSINKVWPGVVKSFAVALASTVRSDFVKGEGIKVLDEVTYPVCVEPKLDGLRLIAVKQDGVVTFYTRNGTVLESMPRIRAALTAAKYDNIVLDGEGMGTDWNESSSVMMSKTQKDDSNMFYNVFDAMPLNDWIEQKCVIPYSARRSLVQEVVLACVDFTDNAPVRQVPHIMAGSEAALKTFFAKCMEDGYEGVMLKTLDTGYRFKRSDNIRKLKPCVTFEGVVVGHYEGRLGTKREGLFGGFNVVLPNGVITRVGGGFNDALKAQIQLDGPDNFIGKIVEIEAQPDPLTKDGLTVDGKARFPVFTRFRDPGDVDPKVVEAGEAYLEGKGER